MFTSKKESESQVTSGLLAMETEEGECGHWTLFQRKKERHKRSPVSKGLGSPTARTYESEATGYLG